MKKRYIAMWSGPRNISTAMMRSWGSRTDTTVIDEPFYAHYLQQTGSPHPGANEVIASQLTDWREVAQQITGEIPNGNSVYYQKHITTHMLAHIELDWLQSMNHCFLIREPRKVVASYSQQRPDNAATDLGFEQQSRIFNHVCEHVDANPLVVDSDLFLQNPAAQLQAMCDHLELDYSDAMLSWEPGIRETDGIWHQWWYHSVAESSGFMPWTDKKVVLNDLQKNVVSECESYYAKLRSRALTTSHVK